MMSWARQVACSRLGTAHLRREFLQAARSVHACYQYPARPKAAVRQHRPQATKATLQNPTAAPVLALAPGIQLPSYCSGCGVRLQSQDDAAPGYFKVPKSLVIDQQNDDLTDVEQIHDKQPADLDASLRQDTEIASSFSDSWLEDTPLADRKDDSTDGIDEEEDPEDLDAFDAEVESWLGGRPAGSAWHPGDESTPQELHRDERPQLLCARCFSLRHYGQVKDLAAEDKLPSFDLGKRAGQKIRLQKHRRAIILCVVDVADFDGSLPRAALSALLQTIGYGDEPSVHTPRDAPHQLVIAVNKIDLLPPQISIKRLQEWVRLRLRQAGLPSASAIHLVSSSKGAGVRDLVRSLHKAVGLRYDVWVVGAQNAGKSSLINAMQRALGKSESGSLTAAWVPGTTLGLLRVPGLLPGKSRLFDTPGVPHSHQMAAVLTPVEVPLLLPKRRLQPRTFRLGQGQSIMLGGLTRVDVLHCPGATLYLTAWLSDQVPCHLGKTEAAADRYQKHVGGQLFPPLGDKKRIARFPGLVETQLQCCGDSWQLSSQDVVIAGLGWVAVTVNGQADLLVWAPPQVAVTRRAALAIDMAQDLQKPGFAALPGAKAKKGSKAGRGGSSNR